MNLKYCIYVFYKITICKPFSDFSFGKAWQNVIFFQKFSGKICVVK